MEVWKDIKEFEGIYQVSNLGNVKRLQHIKISKNKNTIYKKNISEKILSPLNNGSGYLFIRLYNEGNKKRYYVHRLVYETFNNCIIDNDLEVDHIDNNKSNNHLDNLQLLTRKDNMTKQFIDNNKLRVNNKCVDCKADIYFDSIRCNKCNNIYKINKTNKKMEKELKHELLDLIKIFPMTYIGELYGVSDKTIKSWIKRLNI